MMANVQGFIWASVARNRIEYAYGASLPWQPNEAEEVIVRVLNNSSTGMAVIASLVVSPNGHAISDAWTLGGGELDPAGMIAGPTSLSQGPVSPHRDGGNLVLNLRVQAGMYAEMRIPVVWGATDNVVGFRLAPEDPDAPVHRVTRPPSGGYAAIAVNPVIATNPATTTP